VPFRGNGPALTALLGGQVDLLFPSLASSIAYIKSGQLRGLGVTAATRSDAVPELATVGEFVPGYDVDAWYGIGAPKGTPAEIIDMLNRAINAGLADPNLKGRFTDLSAAVLGGSPAEFGKLLVDETEKWGKVVKFSGAKPE
jgi:tripartite-type tricarboxylate transporter receptor subunit TctC